MEDQNSKNKKYDREKPPVFSSWNKLYTMVLLHLAFLIILFYLFTKAFD